MTLVLERHEGTLAMLHSTASSKFVSAWPHTIAHAWSMPMLLPKRFDMHNPFAVGEEEGLCGWTGGLLAAVQAPGCMDWVSIATACCTGYLSAMSWSVRSITKLALDLAAAVRRAPPAAGRERPVLAGSEARASRPDRQGQHAHL